MGFPLGLLLTQRQYSPTYPRVLVVPSSISDNVLKHAGPFRSKSRIPALTYIHPINSCTITRSAQPSTGLRRARSPQDERLVAAIFETTRPGSNKHNSAPATPTPGRSTSDLTQSFNQPGSLDSSDVLGFDEGTDVTSSQVSIGPDQITQVRVYGAQQNNLIIDARPQVNAMAQQVTGFGSENMDHYPNATRRFLGIDNIHVMRKSLEDIVEAIKESDLTPLPPNREKLASSKWLKHIAMILDGAQAIAWTVAINHSHVLIHCSDGWDRTSQLSALAQLCLDPHYRTIEGFITLIEKDWLAFGHMFRYRHGLLGYEKTFQIENERITANKPDEEDTTDTVEPVRVDNPFENVISNARRFFTRKNNDSRENLSDKPSEDMGSPASKKTRDGNRGAACGEELSEEQVATRPKDISPVFHQFLDCTYQLLRQHPTRFEFNELFLRRLLYHVYSCQYGTFLFNNERERVESRAANDTSSVWDYFLSKPGQWKNEKYDATIDDKLPGKERLILPRKDEVRWWYELFKRTDAEMNGPPQSIPPGAPTGIDAADGSVVKGIESGSGSETFGKAVSGVMSAVGSGGSLAGRFVRMDGQSQKPETGVQLKETGTAELSANAAVNGRIPTEAPVSSSTAIGQNNPKSTLPQENNGSSHFENSSSAPGTGILLDSTATPSATHPSAPDMNQSKNGNTIVQQAAESDQPRPSDLHSSLQSQSPPLPPREPVSSVDSSLPQKQDSLSDPLLDPLSDPLSGATLTLGTLTVRKATPKATSKSTNPSTRKTQTSQSTSGTNGKTTMEEMELENQ
jgi:myotubularin-related protein 6/7/8